MGDWVGDSVNIWNDLWLPDDANPLIVTEMLVQLKDAKVKWLMRDKTRVWDNECIKDILCERDAKLVTNIPLSMTQMEDRLSWSGKRKVITRSRVVIVILSIVSRHQGTCPGLECGD